MTDKNELIGLYFPVLDYGFCALVDCMGSDSAVVEAARCSYGAGTKTISNDKGLIRYLLNHKHSTPFEMVEFKFHMKMPIFVARQIVRHRTANINELSGRFSIMPLQFYTPEENDLQYQSTDNKQGRDSVCKEYQEWLAGHLECRDKAIETYTDDIKHNIAREIARIDLPLSTYTEWYWKMDLHNLFHFLKLRCDKHAQLETRMYANIIAGIVKEITPLSYQAWIDYSYCSKSFSRLDFILMNKFNKEGVVPGKDFAVSIGMTNREWEEFNEKLNYDGSFEDFQLDFSSAKSPKFFKEESEKYVIDVT